MKVFLTGASGFIGREFLKKYNHTMPLYRRHKQSEETSDFLIGDICNLPTDLEKRLHDIDCVVHLAGLAHSKKLSWEDYEKTNVDATINLAKMAKKSGVSRFVFISTIGVHGNKTLKPFSVESSVYPHSDYAKSKYIAEKELKKICTGSKMDLVVIRPTLVYGPNARGSFALLVSLVKALPFLPFGNIKNKRSFISVYNLVDLLITCIDHPNAAGKVLLPSDGESVSIEIFTSHIAAGLGKNVMQIPIPQGLMKIALTLMGKKSTYEQLYGNLEVDSKEVYNLLGWTPPFSIAEAMGRLKEKEKNDTYF